MSLLLRSADVHSKDPHARRDMRKAYREFARSFYAAAGRLERFLDLAGDPVLLSFGMPSAKTGQRAGDRVAR